jgi:hypothetical protein
MADPRARERDHRLLPRAGWPVRAISAATIAILVTSVIAGLIGFTVLTGRHRLQRANRLTGDRA